MRIGALPEALRVVMARLRGLASRRRRERELDEEMELHVEMLVQDQLKRGLRLAEARRAAAVIFGGVEQAKEDWREQRNLPLLETASREIRHAVRTLRRDRAFCVAAVLTLGLGVGATSAIFTVLNALLMRPLSLFPDAERLVVIGGRHLTDSRWPRLPVSYPNFVDWRAASRSFEGMAAWSGARANLSGGSEPEQVFVSYVSAGFFEVLSIPPSLGRSFRPEEDRPGANRVVVISQGLWQRAFASDPSVVGRTVSVDGVPHVVVGVAAPASWFPAEGTQLWIPMGLEADEGTRSWQFLNTIARLRPGVSLASARTEMDAVAQRLRTVHPQANAGYGVRVAGLRDDLVADVRPALWRLFGSVGLVFLIACGNVASLFAARGAARRRELAIRSALGASPRRLALHLSGEALVVASAGALVGLILARWTIAVLVALEPMSFPRLGEAVRLDGRAFAFTAALSVLAAVLFALVPALDLSRSDPREALKGAAPGLIGSTHRKRIREPLVVGQVALALVLLTGAGLLFRSLGRLLAVDPGFDAPNVLTFSVALPPSRYPDRPARSAFYEQARTRLEALPGVVAAGSVSILPMDGLSRTAFAVEGQKEARHVSVRFAGPGYFQALGVPLLRGRSFSERDRSSAPDVIVVNETLTRTLFPGTDALGRRLVHGDKAFEIVGIVRDVRHYGLEKEPEPEVYVSSLQQPPAAMTFVLRGTVDALSLTSAARAAIRQVDSEQPVASVRTMRQVVAATLAGRRTSLARIAAIAALSVTLSMVGLYAVLAYEVTRRTQEIGVHLALGATRTDVLWLIVAQGVRLAALGAVVGVAGSVAAARLIRGFLFEVTAVDPMTLAGVCVLLMLAALVASYVPARRAARLDPMAALRAS